MFCTLRPVQEQLHHSVLHVAYGGGGGVVRGLSVPSLRFRLVEQPSSLTVKCSACGIPVAADGENKGKARDGRTAHLNASSPSLLPRSGDPCLGWHWCSLFIKHWDCSNWLYTYRPLGGQGTPEKRDPRSFASDAASAQLRTVLHPLLLPSGGGCGCRRQPPSQPRGSAFWSSPLPSLDKGSFPEAKQVSWERDVHFWRGLAAEHHRAVST